MILAVVGSISVGYLGQLSHMRQVSSVIWDGTLDAWPPTRVGNRIAAGFATTRANE